jgi:peptidoglycan glycosyltransferase
VREYPGDYDVTCLQAHGELTFRDAFAQSCNCAFAQIADQLGGETLQRYAELFGLTSQLQFDGVTTAAGNIEATNVSKVSVAWSAVGQYKDTVNPCTFMRFMGAIAGDGVGADPYVVSGIQVGNTATYTAQTQRTERMLSTETAQILQEMMRNNVLIKYGAENFPGLTVCAKSGTAEVGGEKKPNAMFAGFVDDEAYPLAFIVAVEDGGYGRPTCVPILSKVLAVCKEVMDSK